MIRRPHIDTDRFDRVWDGPVYTLRGAYRMNE
jgi:hypothetical protein